MGSDGNGDQDQRDAHALRTATALAIAGADVAITGGWLSVMYAAAQASVDWLHIETLKGKTSATALAEAIDDEGVAFFEDAASGWEVFGPQWCEKPPEKRPTASDVAAVLTEGRKVYASCADHEKRRLLHNAIVNAFDPELYEAGMTRRLFRLLDELEYGDVVVLKRIYEKFKTGTDTDVATVKCWPGTDDHHHLTMLVRAGCVLSVGKRVENQETLQDHNRIRVSALGERLLKLLREPPRAVAPE